MRGRSSENSSLGYRPDSRSRTLLIRSSEISAKFAHRRTRSVTSRTEHSSTAARCATICCASTSSGLRRYCVVSIAPSIMRRVTTAASSRSPRCFGKIDPRDGSPTWCPARPMRCNPRLTAPGDSTWMTKSTAPMSMPSSSDEVATMARRSPRFNWSSMTTRCSRASDPWCALTSSSTINPDSASTMPGTPSSTASSLSLAASRSAARRALQKMIVVRLARMRLRISG